MEATHEGIVKDGCLPVPWYLHFGFLVNPLCLLEDFTDWFRPAAWLWPRKFVAGCHGGRTRKARRPTKQDFWQQMLSVCRWHIKKEWDRLFFGFKLKVYHQYPGYLHTRREKLPLLLWPSNWIYWFTFDMIIPLWNHLGGYRCVQNHFPKMMRTRILGEFDGGGAG